ncbi:MAG: 2-oxo acid dehydrogenase subunit E2, partial [Luteimonas sp.]|nr:2-oxo acid dehydrogenase subunit E2 [Luteimonas sp.]
MAELKEAKVPDIGGYDDVPVIEVLVAVGDTVARDQGLVTLESDKATMEVPSAHAGVVRELKVKLGDTLSEGSVVAIIETTDAAAEAPAAKADAAPAPAAPPKPNPDPVVEPVAVSGQADRLAQASIAAQEAGTLLPQGAPPVRFEADALVPGKVPYASPAVRLFARELGVDLSKVSGSGTGGRITKEDVQKFVKGVLSGATAAPAAGGGGGLSLLPWPKVDFAKFGEIEVRPLSRIKKISGANLARNWAMIPHVTQFDDADITDLEALRVQLNKEAEKAKSGVKLTMLAFLIKASANALKTFPDFNASLDGENLVYKQYFHIGFAADTPNGLVVPVIRDADRKGVLEIAGEMGTLSG